MKNIRTDLALELSEKFASPPSGVRSEKKELEEGYVYTKVFIDTEEAGKQMGKPPGRYFMMETGDLSSKSREELYQAAQYTAEAISEMLEGKKCRNALVVGLGNRAITPDAFGPRVCEKLFVTRHLKEVLPDLFKKDYSEVSAVSPGVLGTTGVETGEIARGLSAQIKPDVIIAIDALAAQKTERIGSSIQVSDTGITPGSGIGNKRRALNEKYLGVKVLSVGVPMVTYAAVIACDLLEAAFNKTVEEEDINNLFTAIQAANGSDLIVTPKNIDIIVEKASTMVSMALNIALNPGFDAKTAAEIADI